MIKDKEPYKTLFVRCNRCGVILVKEIFDKVEAKNDVYTTIVGERMRSDHAEMHIAQDKLNRIKEILSYE